jgi:hypothetical protein
MTPSRNVKVSDDQHEDHLVQGSRVGVQGLDVTRTTVQVVTHRVPREDGRRYRARCPASKITVHAVS